MAACVKRRTPKMPGKTACSPTGNPIGEHAIKQDTAALKIALLGGLPEIMALPDALPLSRGNCNSYNRAAQKG